MPNLPAVQLGYSTEVALSGGSRALRKQRRAIAEAEALEVRKVEAVSTVAHISMAEIKSVSDAERFFAHQSPHAAARLQMVADTAAFAMAERVHSFNRQL